MSRDQSNTPPPIRDCPASQGADVSDARIARAEQRLAMLRELAEIGMALTRELARRELEGAPEAAADPNPTAPKPAPKTVSVPGRDPADAFARLSRAVRLTLVLEAKAEDELDALRDGGTDGEDEAPFSDPYLPNPGPPRDYPSAYRNKVRDAVFDVVNREIKDPEPAYEILDALHERLTEGERYDAFIHRPLKQAVAAVCNDLGLHPDWSRWTGDGWPPPPVGVPRRFWDETWQSSRRPTPQHRPE